jgi:glycerophosphoryl diester phosphodiesterase
MFKWILAGAALPLVGGTWLWMVAPTRREHPDADAFNGLLVAHRGLHDATKGIPENSLAAYRAAGEKGFGIEIDLHLTADGRVVSFHDGDLKRVCGVDKTPEALTLDELKTYRLLDTTYTIPTLEEVLETVDGKVPLLIEFKSVGGNTTALCEAADALLKNYKGVYRVQSFYPTALKWYRKHRPEIARGQLSSCFRKEPDPSIPKTLLGCLIANFLGRPDFIAYDHKYPKAWGLRICRRFGADTAAWTITDQAALNRCRGTYNTCIFEGFLPEE